MKQVVFGCIGLALLVFIGIKFTDRESEIPEAKIAIEETDLSQKNPLKKVVDEYYRLNLIVFQKGSTVKDIDAIFELFTDDFVYIHPRYGGTYTREDLYKGYVRNQKNGGYNGRVTDIRVENMIIGLNAVATEKRFIQGSEVGEPEMTLFELREGKIFRITEFW